MPWRKPPVLDFEALERPWRRDAHLKRLDTYLLPRLQERRWTVAELRTYCSERKRLRFIDPPLIERWLETADERGLVRRHDGDAAQGEQVWEVTDRGYQRDLKLVWKLLGAAGTVSAAVALVLGVVTGDAKPAAQAILATGLALIVGYLIGAQLGNRSPRVRRGIVAREREVAALRARRRG